MQSNLSTSPVTLEVLNPTGASEVTNVHAPRLTDLHGKIICELGNRSWEADRTFPVIRELLQERFPDAKIVPWSEFPVASDTSDISDILKKKGCQAVIVGNAA